MCGITGIVTLGDELSPALKAAINPMTDALAHRGPDGRGIFVNSHVALGHRRLAIIDRAGGAQPLSNEDQTCWVTFNGEIYNHAEIRQRLIARGHRFRTRSDTETIVHAYEEFGPACVEQFEGMFAFAVYDQRTRDVFIARDRLGKKPLFYARLGNSIHFASEIKSFFHSPVWDGQIDLDQLEGYLSLGYFLAPYTAYRHVRKLEPGHWLRVRDGRVEVRSYWDVDRFDDFAGSEAEAIEEIEHQLALRVRERLESEVPLGAFLSGGLDSGLVVAHMAQAHGQPVVTTTIGFGEAAHNELAPAQVTARHFGTKHYAHVVEPRLEEILPSIVSAFDEPFADSSSVPTWYVSREARRHVTVALSGDGGDETFGGYTFRYIPHALESRVRAALPGESARRVAGLLGAAWPRSRSFPRPLRLGNFLENVARDPAAAYYWDLCFMKPAAVQRLMGRSGAAAPWRTSVYETVTAPYRRCPSHSPVQKAEYADLKIYLPNDVLVKVDRMSMQHSLEVRCPLLDRRLVELAFRLPQDLKQADRTGKHLLKRVAETRLPAELLRLPKRGFTAPVGSWITGAHRRQFEEDVLSSRSAVASLVDQSAARRMLIEHASGKADHSFGLWALWILERWAKHQAVGAVSNAAALEATAAG
jgi:asparagine synthase (glutamine-hydrolysing)